MFRKFPEEILVKICETFSAKSLLTFGEVSSLFHRISEDDELWRTLVTRDFSIFEKYKNEKRSWKELYKFLFVYASYYADKLVSAFRPPHEKYTNEKNFHFFYFICWESFFVHAKSNVMNVEEILGDNASYIYQYLIRRTNFIADIKNINHEEMKEYFQKEHNNFFNHFPVIYTPIHILAYLNRAELLKEILEENPLLIDIQGYHNYTPLHAAALNGSLDAVKVLLSLGANRFARDYNTFEPKSSEPIRSPFVIALFHAHHDLLPSLSGDCLGDMIEHLPEEPAFSFYYSEGKFINTYPYSKLYAAEENYLTQKNKIRFSIQDNSQLTQIEMNILQLYLNDPAHNLEDKASKIKKTITWLVMNDSIEGKTIVNVPYLEKILNLRKELCEVHNLYLQKMRERQEETDQKLDNESLIVSENNLQIVVMQQSQK